MESTLKRPTSSKDKAGPETGNPISTSLLPALLQRQQLSITTRSQSTGASGKRKGSTDASFSLGVRDAPDQQDPWDLRKPKGPLQDPKPRKLKTSHCSWEIFPSRRLLTGPAVWLKLSLSQGSLVARPNSFARAKTCLKTI